MSNAPNSLVSTKSITPSVVIAPAPAALRQVPLFARKTLIEYPPSHQTADALGEVLADDQHYYYVKGDAHGKIVRASEWICTHIAEDIHIGAPPPMVIEVKSGDVVFGSRRIAQVSDLVTTANFLISPTLSNSNPSTTGLQSLLSSIYVFDMFINNDDRHLGNYLTVSDQDVRRLYAFDFSRSLFWHWPFQAFPSMPCNTVQCGRLLRAMHGFDQTAALATLDRIGALAPDTLQGFIRRMPTDWLPGDVHASFMDWWNNGGRSSRLSNLRKGVGDGTLL